jgi:signal transduction histidine kinase
MKNFLPTKFSEITSFFFELVIKNRNYSKIILYTVFLCLLPFILNVLGFNFGLNFPVKNSAASLSEMSRGSYVHTIIETVCVLTAIFTVVFAFVVYEIKKDIINIVIATTLFCAGLLDAFHILASDQLIWAPDLDDVVVFTWLISRIFNASIILVASIIILSDNDFFEKLGERSVYQVFFFFVLITLLTIIIVFFNVNLLPRITLPDFFVKMPLELFPLIIFLANGLVILPIFYKRNPTIFSFALLISMIPAIFTQAYIMFSGNRYDNFFVIARFMKALSYLVPFTGILVDYILTYRSERKIFNELQKAQEEILHYQRELENKVDELNRSNTELEQFAYIASHDLQEPLRKIQAFGDRLTTKYNEVLQGDGQDYLQRMKNAASRMQVLINDLLNFSRVKKTNQKFENIQLNILLKEVVEDLESQIVQTGAKVELGNLPVIPGDKRQLGQLFQNLISNALKFHKKNVEPLIEITADRLSNAEIIHHNLFLDRSYYKISVKDNGIGFDIKYLDKIFTIFQRLHGRHEYEGTGIGLAICRKVVDNHGGMITADSKLDIGTTFYIFLPEKQ